MSNDSKTILSGTFTSTAQSNAIAAFGRVNLLIEGGIGTVALEKSFDNGTSWLVVSKNSDGEQASYTTASNVAFNGSFTEPESGIQYRLNCTAYTSGSINYRISHSRVGL